MAARREREGPKGVEAGGARRGPVQRAGEVSGRRGRLPEGLSHSGGGARRIAAVLIPGRGAWTSRGSGAGAGPAHLRGPTQAEKSGSLAQKLLSVSRPSSRASNQGQGRALDRAHCA